MAQTNYDPQRIRTLLHYEKIPGFVLSDEQISYLEGYRAYLAETQAIEDSMAQKASVFGSFGKDQLQKATKYDETQAKKQTTKKNPRKITRKTSKK